MPRVAPADATEFMDEFMEAMHAEFPKLVIQHEDFVTERAFEVGAETHIDAIWYAYEVMLSQYLARYQHKYPMFNEYETPSLYANLCSDNCS